MKNKTDAGKLTFAESNRSSNFSMWQCEGWENYYRRPTTPPGELHPGKYVQRRNGYYQLPITLSSQSDQAHRLVTEGTDMVQDKGIFIIE